MRSVRKSLGIPRRMELYASMAGVGYPVMAHLPEAALLSEKLSSPVLLDRSWESLNPQSRTNTIDDRENRTKSSKGIQPLVIRQKSYADSES
ncbi:hypothetical protein Tco_0861349 [Tanacetum coccineum]|uniref:Uncharacterized protein n=1 Tax=Tanacetum coccineum TaxID=301880 RepID=A0ABQ5BKK1_9ASTR